jgi:TRAP transporter TatT component family protein
VALARVGSLASRLACAGVAATFAAGCTTLIGGIAADTLSAAILNQDDPALVESGVPAYLLLIDGLISEHPDNVALLSAGAQLFALYGSRFATPERAVTLTAKARRYGERAICLAHEPACHWADADYNRLVAELEAVGKKDIDPLYSYAVSWLSHLDATSEDWTAVAELPWVEAVLERTLALDETYEDGAVHGYLGILNSLRPPALGGKPDVAREHFERAIELSGGRDLSIKVEYARRYARLVFDQELHDRLLTEVLNAPVDAPGKTLFNVLAKKEAETLLASSKEYF